MASPERSDQTAELPGAPNETASSLIAKIFLNFYGVPPTRIYSDLLPRMTAVAAVSRQIPNDRDPITLDRARELQEEIIDDPYKQPYTVGDFASYVLQKYDAGYPPNIAVTIGFASQAAALRRGETATDAPLHEMFAHTSSASPLRALQRDYEQWLEDGRPQLGQSPSSKTVLVEGTPDVSLEAGEKTHPVDQNAITIEDGQKPKSESEISEINTMLHDLETGLTDFAIEQVVRIRELVGRYGLNADSTRELLLFVADLVSIKENDLHQNVKMLAEMERRENQRDLSSSGKSRLRLVK